MSLWKYSFELIMRDLELTKKKKQALDELFTSKKISESTYEYLEKELNETLIDLQNHLKSLTDKMTARSEELEKQKCTLELFLASAEIHHAAGEIDNEAYEAQTKAILLGLDYTKQELNDIKGSISKTISEFYEAPTALTTTETIEKEETTESTITESLTSETSTIEAPVEQL